MGNLANSYIGAGGATAFDRGMSPERFAERSAAYAQKEQSDQDLRTLKATEPTAKDRETMADAQTLELQNMLQTQKEMMRGTNRRTTFDAYTRYDQGDGDVRHINTMINDINKTGSPLFGKITRVDKVTENERQMLLDAGYSKTYTDLLISNPDLNKSLVIYTLADGGGKEIGNLDDLKGLTGYNDYADATELNRQKVARETALVAGLGYAVGPNTPEAYRKTIADIEHLYPGMSEDQLAQTPEFKELYPKNLEALRNSSFGRLGRGRQGTEKVPEGYGRRYAAEMYGLYPGDEGYENALNEGMRAYGQDVIATSGIKNTKAAASAEEELLDMGFLDDDFNIDSLTNTERARIGQKMRSIEGPGGSKLSDKDEKTLSDIQRLTSLGSLASELTDQQTGIMDSMLQTARKYIFDKVDDVQAEAAYSTYRNLVQHALYGAALTPNEAKTFSKQFGSLKQQRGPILDQFRVSLQELKDAYKAIERTNNVFVMKWRTGKTKAELQDVISSLDARIDMINKINTPGESITTITEPSTKGTELTPEIEAELDEIFKPDGVPE